MSFCPAPKQDLPPDGWNPSDYAFLSLGSFLSFPVKKSETRKMQAEGKDFSMVDTFAVAERKERPRPLFSAKKNGRDQIPRGEEPDLCGFATERGKPPQAFYGGDHKTRKERTNRDDSFGSEPSSPLITRNYQTHRKSWTICRITGVRFSGAVFAGRTRSRDIL